MIDWIHYIRSDSNKALIELYDIYWAQTLAWIKSEFSMDNHDAEEIFQASIVILYENVVTGKLTALTSNIKTYLFSIIKNKVIHYNRLKSKISYCDALELIKDDIAEEYKEIDRDTIEKAISSLYKLGEPCKTLLELAYFQEMSIEDITQLMGYKNKDTAKNQKYKCMKRLQNLFFG